MADVNSSNALKKSRPILGEITNLPSKREFPETEKCGTKRSNTVENANVKKSRVTPTLCTEIDLLKENLLKSSQECDSKDLWFGCNAISASSIDGRSRTDNVVHSLIGDNVILGSSKICDGKKAVECFDNSKTELNLGTDLVDCCGEIGISEGNGLATNSIDLQKGRATIFAATEVDNLKESDLVNGSDVPVGAEASSPMINQGSKIALDSSKISNGGNDPNSTDQPREVTIEIGNVEASDEFADTSRTVSEEGGDTLSCGKDLDAAESKATHRDISGYQNDGEEQNADNFVLSQSGSIDCMIIPDSQESRVFGVDRATEPMKGNECGYICEGIDSIKACSCSFCTKAAYIWLDLNYQDMKGRVSAMKRSQKEASALAERSIRNKPSENHVAQSSTGVSNLVSDLMNQWRSLFNHMGGILDEECNQLEARLQPLAELREEFKADLEMTQMSSGAASERH